ncbi:DUF305 domain-containing protein [Micromonospora sp. RP3T]|uniref:DUF305 domain-containing protein n=1 Tax=Micromonospora sp. RP3T TaxID=2135446 RepID=UPI001E56EFE4|nr:DUF305 domain-containing protein [Micromonospora sp. RP3T]
MAGSVLPGWAVCLAVIGGFGVALAAASGRDFDKQFLTMMIAHHEGAISMGRTEATQDANTDAKALAERISTSQQTEIDTMRSILARI